MDKADVQAAFAAAGLTRLTKDLDAITKSSLRLLPTQTTDAQIAVGMSKLGGMPDVPTNFVWPEWKGTPQSFIAQIRLDDAHAFDTDNVLPPRGMLWFFYDASQQTYGADPGDKGGWFVSFSENPEQLQRVPFPATIPVESQFKSSTLRFVNEVTLSQQPQLEIGTNFDWTEEEQQRYETLLAAFPTPEDHATIHHRLLGNPNTIQDDMREECQLASNGIADASDPRVGELLASAMEWQLLLQVDSDDNAGMRWASTGMLYYWLKRSDLQAQRFDASWLVLQSE